jgi:hypothetical protein
MRARSKKDVYPNSGERVQVKSKRIWHDGGVYRCWDW